MVPSRHPHPHCTPFPPHEQLLVAAVGGAVVVVVLRHRLSSLSLSFHPLSTPRAVAREAGGGWCAVMTWQRWRGVVTWQRWRVVVTWRRWSFASSSFRGMYNLGKERNKLVSLHKKNQMKKKLTIHPNNAITSFGPR